MLHTSHSPCKLGVLVHGKCVSDGNGCAIEILSQYLVSFKTENGAEEDNPRCSVLVILAGRLLGLFYTQSLLGALRIRLWSPVLLGMVVVTGGRL